MFAVDIRFAPDNKPLRTFSDTPESGVRAKGDVSYTLSLENSTCWDVP
jgi:hypothetical protein